MEITVVHCALLSCKSHDKRVSDTKSIQNLADWSWSGGNKVETFKSQRLSNDNIIKPKINNKLPNSLQTLNFNKALLNISADYCKGSRSYNLLLKYRLKS